MALPPDIKTPSLSEKERIARIQLYRSENVGPITFYQLLDRYKSAVKALSMLPELARRGGRQASLRVCAESEVLKELELTHKFKAQMVVWGEESYPSVLSKLPDTTPVLTIKGNAGLFAQKTVAIVGARNCSLIGKKIATTLAEELGQQGYVIASGLARGIDAAAHLGALPTGTLAVIAGGINQVYPPENERLNHAIAEKGLLVAESPYGVEPQANLFPRRNRLISGLSAGVVVVEAALQSGSLITARYANEQGKEVFVVPGSPVDSRYKGSNQLIKQGASLITSSHDVLDVLDRPYLLATSNPAKELEITAGSCAEDEEPLQEISNIILNLLSSTAIPLDELTRMCRLTTTQVLAALLQLELAGKIYRHPGNGISRAV